MIARIIHGDCRELLRTLPPESVQCVVTSPPYWGLRDYKLEPLVWGGQEDCEHEWGGVVFGSEGWQKQTAQGLLCKCCGAWCGSLGLEPTPEMYVQHLVGIFRELKRVLRRDGTAWLNLGDSYSSQGGSGTGGNLGRINRAYQQRNYRTGVVPALKPKDLVGMPWRVAFALQAEGWYLRSDCIWAKPNPMPESVTDRPTRSHEYLFLLAKSQRYFYDAEAVREPFAEGTAERISQSSLDSQVGGYKAEAYQADFPGRKMRDRRPADVLRAMRDNGNEGRNIRSVWTIATEPFPEAHFATFPKALVGPCIKAGSAEGNTVLDPFCGSGTTGLVALRLGRAFIGIDLSTEYCEIARQRIEQDAPLLNRVEVAVEAGPVN